MLVRTSKREKLDIHPVEAPVFPTRTRKHIMGSAGSLLPLSAACTCQTDFQALLCSQRTAGITARTGFVQALPLPSPLLLGEEPIIDSPSIPSNCKVLDQLQSSGISVSRFF